MKIYGVPLSGSVFIEAESPQMALEIARKWSESVLRLSMTVDTISLPHGMDLIILRPQDGNIKDATEEIMKLVAESKKK